ncbi:Hypothetical protein CM240_0101 [Clostridium bornimense]|uniref:DUF1450 domain-containing protein n=1 Tax=Clostridium bornimense TaxID=1216932 RepID=W6SCC7_9CLOT|nr:hypothetical protein [Clostridium bornimense]CDM67280.1 Hypothetical protein CM240_0101 [Clostridium bornimense]
MIRICPFCSDVDIEELKEIVGEENVDEGCIGMCGQSHVAYFDDELIEAISEESLIEALKERLEL